MYRVASVAKRLECSVATVYSLIEKGKLGHYRCPGVRVSEEQIAEYLAATKQERREPEPSRSKPPRPKLRHVRL